MESDIYNLNPLDGTDYTTYNKLLLKSATDNATKLRSEDKRWFYHSKDALLPAIMRRDQLLHSLCTATSHTATVIKTALTTAQEIVTDTISLAKYTWSSHLAQKVNDMKFTPKQAWKAVQVLVGGRKIHHVKPVVMRMRLPDGTLAMTDAKNASVLAPNFERIYTRDRPITWDALEKIPTCDTVEGINQLIEWEEVKFAVRKLANDKPPGLNDVPPDAFKALSKQNLDPPHNFFNAYCRGDIDFTEWHEGQVVPVPKS